MATERFMKAKARAMFKPYVFIQSMSSLATSGVPDLYISGKKDCFLEWKHDEKTKGAIRPKLSPLQKQWCDDRYAEGRQVFVVVTTDSKTGILFKHGEWNSHSNDRRPLKEIITQILEYVL
ncbi:MAG: hypothetical protein WC069_07170 [Candidatus Shapirobacteria bacterium]